MIRDFSVGPIGENVYLVERYGQALAIIDPGDEADRIVAEAQLSMQRIGTQEILVICTHGHLDHVSALPEVVDSLRAQGYTLTVYAPQGDSAYFGPPAEATNRRVFADIRASAYFSKHWKPIPLPDVWYGNGFRFPGTDLYALHTPGHTPGSSCIVAEGGSAVLSGDTLFRDGRGRTDNHDSDERALVRSIRETLCVLPDATRVWPGHGESTSIGREKNYYL
ncbi:MAG TPA: MBL fold metallo-hydrolase [Spirochaetales bacterium]|nr:MBL fold metallo-hydrolase [Spirochaetales bacterium]